MRACLSLLSGNQMMLTLQPENAHDQESLRLFSERLGSPKMINCRGVKYLDPQVEFLIQPMPRGD